MTGRLHFIKNSFSNLVNGMVGAVVLIVVPHFFVHDFPPGQFALWMLILQLANLVNVLNVGLSIAIGRFVAVFDAKHDQEGMMKVTSAGIQILSLAAFVGILLVGSIAFLMPLVFKQIAPGLMPAARQSLLWIGCSLALGLPANGFSGAMIGLRRNEVPAAVNIVGKTALGAMLVFTAARTHDLVSVAQAFFIVNCVIYLLNFCAFRWLCNGWRLSLLSDLAGPRRELVRYCASLSVWSVAMMLVTGVDTSIVGAIDYHSVAAYGLAANIGIFFSGAVNMLMNPMIQIFAGQNARGDIDASVNLLRISSFVAALALSLAGLCMVGLEHYGFTLWVGKNLAEQAFPFFCLLVVSNTIRNSATPYALYLLGHAQQQRVMLTPLLEGTTNFVFSVVGAWVFGAIGVAIGAIIGSCFGVCANFVYNFPRTLPVNFDRARFAFEALLLPSFLTLPCLGLILWLRPEGSIILVMSGWVVGCVLAALPAAQWIRSARYALS